MANNIKIMIDAGHYRKTNRSPCNSAYYESDMTWKLHLLLKKELESTYGFTVGTTRADKDVDLEVYSRGLKADGYDMFISLHSNALSYSVTDGVDRPVIIYPMAQTSDQISFANRVGAAVRNVMGTKQKYQLYIREYPNRPGVDYYGVIRGAVAAGCPMPFIIECGFHTDTYCTNWLLNDNNLKKLALAIAKSIADHYGVKAIEPAPPAKYTIQVGAYRVRSSAQRLAETISAKKLGYGVTIVTGTSNGLTVYKVRVGGFATKAEANNALAKIKAIGYTSAYVVLI